MDYFYSIFSNYPTKIPCLASHGHGIGQSCHEVSQTKESGSRVSPIEQSRQHSRKRRTDEEEEAEDGQTPPFKVQRLRDEPGAVAPRLACPYFKRNPGKYQQRGSCIGPGWVTAHRVK